MPKAPRVLALSDARLARRWARRGLAAALHLERRAEGLRTPGVRRETSRIWAEALVVHFKLRSAGAPALAADLLEPLGWIRASFARLLETLELGALIFHDASAEHKQAHGAGAGAIAYALGGRVWFTSRYRPPVPGTAAGYGPPARAAMVLHELVHVIDPLSGLDENHISEWDPRYAAMTAEQSAHNASSYAAFAQHACYLEDTRFGAGEETRHARVPPRRRTRLVVT